MRSFGDDRALAADEALIETSFVAICGTDLDVIDGVSDRARPPVILGHEWAGRVATVGSHVDRRLSGTFVVGDNTHADGREIGFELPGGFASHFAIVARNLRPLPENLLGPAAALIEPLAVSVRAVRSTAIRPEDSVLVVGDGIIGLLIARIASLSVRNSVMLVGRHEDRLRIARAFGVNAGHESQLGELHEPWSVVFEASGKAAGLEAAIEAAAPRARVILAGDYGSASVPMHPTSLVRKELHVTGTNASKGAWDEAVRLASTGVVDLCAMSPLVLAFDQWPEALQAARERRAPRVVLRHRTVDSSP